MQRLLGSGAGLQKVACRQAQEAVSSNCSRLLSCRASGPGPSSTRMFQGDCAAGRNPKQTPMRGPQPCRVTNTAKEIYQAVGKPEDDLSVENHDTLLPGGKRGVLEATVKKPFLDAMAEDEVDLLETSYWFNPPADGWPDQVPNMEALEEDEGFFPAPYHRPDDHLELVDEETGEPYLQTRIPLEAFSGPLAGEVMTGIVTDVWLYHGLQVDLGGVWDGLVPMSEEDWAANNQNFLPGMTVEVTVAKVMKPGLYRWPLVLRLASQDMASKVMNPDDYHHPINHAWAYSQGYSVEQLLAETGRTYTPTSIYLKSDDADIAREIQDAMGADVDDYWDDPREEPGMEEWAMHRMEEVDHMASGIMENR